MPIFIKDKQKGIQNNSIILCGREHGGLLPLIFYFKNNQYFGDIRRILTDILIFGGMQSTNGIKQTTKENSTRKNQVILGSNIE